MIISEPSLFELTACLFLVVVFGGMYLAISIHDTPKIKAAPYDFQYTMIGQLYYAIVDPNHYRRLCETKEDPE